MKALAIYGQDATFDGAFDVETVRQAQTGRANAQQDRTTPAHNAVVLYNGAANGIEDAGAPHTDPQSWPAEVQARKEIMANFGESRAYRCAPMLENRDQLIHEQYSELDNRTPKAANSATIARAHSANAQKRMKSFTAYNAALSWLDAEGGISRGASPDPTGADPNRAVSPGEVLADARCQDPSGRSCTMRDVGVVYAAAAEPGASDGRITLEGGVAASSQACARAGSLNGGVESGDDYGSHQQVALEAMRRRHMRADAPPPVAKSMDATLASELQLGDVAEDLELHI